MLDGITAGQVLFNILIDSSPDAAIFKAETIFYGTVLAPDRLVTFQEGIMYGAIIANEVRIISGGELTHVEFVPEPASILLLGLGGLVLLRKTRP